MIIQKVNIPKLMLDNDAAYINHIQYLVESIDEYATLTVIQKIDSIGFHIIPSDEKLKSFLIKAIRKSHYKLGLKIDFSKSINATNKISFWTCFN
jgi:pentose-5-phosphate-3-epimerase